MSKKATGPSSQAVCVPRWGGGGMLSNELSSVVVYSARCSFNYVDLFCFVFFVHTAKF